MHKTNRQFIKELLFAYTYSADSKKLRRLSKTKGKLLKARYKARVLKDLYSFNVIHDCHSSSGELAVYFAGLRLRRDIAEQVLSAKVYSPSELLIQG